MPTTKPYTNNIRDINQEALDAAADAAASAAAAAASAASITGSVEEATTQAEQAQASATAAATSAGTAEGHAQTAAARATEAAAAQTSAETFASAASTQAGAAQASASAAADSATTAQGYMATSAANSNTAQSAANAAAAARDEAQAFLGNAKSPLLPVSGLKVVPFGTTNANNGNTDLYTVPAGKRAYIPHPVRVVNTTGASVTAGTQIKIGGNYYPLHGSATVTDTSSTGGSPWALAATVNAAIGIVLEAGETIALNATAAGLFARGVAYEFPDTEALRSYKVLNAPSGLSTLYTVPTGKVATFGMQHLSSFLVNGTGSPSLSSVGFMMPPSSAAAAIHMVPVGDTPTNSNRILGATGTTIPVGHITAMSAQESLAVSCAVSGMTAWVNVFELLA